MINRQPVILSSKVSIHEAIAQISKSNQTYAVVIDQDSHGSTFAILTETNILKAISTVPNWQEQAISSIPKSSTYTITEIPENLNQLWQLFQESQTSHVVLINCQDQIDGVVTETELLKNIYANSENQIERQSNDKTSQIKQKITEISPNILSVYSLDTHSNIYVNSQVTNILGYELAEIAAMGSQVSATTVHPKDLPRLNQHLHQCRTLADGETLEIEYRAKHINGHWLWLHSTDTPFTRSADGKVIETLSITQDISTRKLTTEAIKKHNLALETLISDRTKSLRYINQELLAEISERKLATVALRESEDKFRHIFEDSPIGISLVGLDGKYMQVNPTFCQMLSYENSELKRLSVFEITNPQNICLEKDLMSKITHGVINQYRLEKNYIKKDQQTLLVSQTTAPIRDSQDHVRYFINMVEDISDRTKAAENLRQSEERFRKIFEESPIGMAILGLDQRIVKINTVLSQMLGYEETELINETLNFFTHGHDQEATNRLAKYLYQGHVSSYQIEQRCIRKNQQIIWISLNTSVLRDQEGEILNVLIMLQDITKQKESQAQITNSLAEKEILLQEIHHRVKNNLQVIASLLELQARSSHDQQVINLFTDSQNRIHSMALIHEQLCLSPKFEHIDFKEYIKNLVSNLFAFYGINSQQIKCILNVEPVHIQFQTAIPCGLILNEIVSNSLKHAFIGRDRGEIQIQLHQQEHLCHLVICDNGIGMKADFAWDQINSLGLRLVRILAKQLDATITVDQSQGTSLSLCFAITKLQTNLESKSLVTSSNMENCYV